MTMNNQRNLGLLLVLMVIFTAMRWPGLLPWNFSPVYAICFCAGVYFKGWRAWLLPVGLMFISDVVMNHFHYRPLGFSTFTSHMLVTYALYLGLVGLGWRITEKAHPSVLIIGGILGACVFYFATNSVAWLNNPVYAKSWAGWVQSFTTGEPGYPPPIVFFRNTALSGALFTAVIVFAVCYARANETAEAESQLKA
jgi:hypothetical protein